MKRLADSKERFSSRVEAYVAARPRYPQEVVDVLRAKIHLTTAWQIVDVGSGTGISCEPFLRHGNPVTAVEPNEAMRNAAEKSLGGFPKFRSVNGSAETTTLPDQSAELVVAAQAFHWFDLAAARSEFKRILRPGGYVVLMWNDRRLSGTPFLEAYEKLLVTHGTDYLRVRHENVGPNELTAFFGSSGFQSATLVNHQHLDFEGLELRLLSSSYVPGENDPRSEPMLADLRKIFDRHQAGGRVTIDYDTRLYFERLG